MTKILLCGFDGAENTANELSKCANYDLRVRSNALENTEPDLDIAILGADIPAPNGSKIIRVFKDDGINTDIAIAADDFICYPISASELNARICRLIAPENRIFEKGELKIDFKSTQVYINKSLIHLTLHEYKLLSLLAHNTGKTVTYKEILHALWESPIGNEMLSIRVFITAIRRKFASAGAIENHIITHASKGYELI